MSSTTVSTSPPSSEWVALERDAYGADELYGLLFEFPEGVSASAPSTWTPPPRPEATSR